MEILTGHRETEAALWMEKAAAIAADAKCRRAKCGAVIVRDDVLLGGGYNAPPLDDTVCNFCDHTLTPNKGKYDATCCIHAEWRAIIAALKKHPADIIGSTLHFTRVDDGGSVIRSGEPYCTVCSRLALDVGIATFVLWHDRGITAYPTDEYNTLSYQFSG